MNKDITGSLVLYKSNISDVEFIIRNFTSVVSVRTLYLIDNSPTNELSCLKSSNKVEYYHNPTNIGFGAAHNIALNEAIKTNSKYHFVINPDVKFEARVIDEMVNYMEKKSDIGMMMPKILNLDDSIQFLPKLLPSPYSLMMRKVKFPKFVYTPFINKYELRKVPENKIHEAPILSGCFTLFNINALKEIGLYDDIFFMYFEDWDISRRINQKYKTMYYPLVSVYHAYESGANKNKKLFNIFLKSAVYYFNKWGWFFDKDRRRINKKTLSQFK